MTISRLIFSGLTSLLLATHAWAAELVAAELVMVEEDGCYWCAQWNADIGGIYDKTSEGKFAPLRRVDITEMPADLEIARRVNFTPTFLVVIDNKEVARLEGYPGDQFFWPLLGKLLADHAGYIIPQG